MYDVTTNYKNKGVVRSGKNVLLVHSAVLVVLIILVFISVFFVLAASPMTLSVVVLVGGVPRFVRDRVGHLLGDVVRVGVGGVVRLSLGDRGLAGDLLVVAVARPVALCRRAAARRRGGSRTRRNDGRGYRPTPASVAEGGAGEGRESEVSAAYRGISRSNGPRARVGVDAERGREANGGSGGRDHVGGGGYRRPLRSRRLARALRREL